MSCLQRLSRTFFTLIILIAWFLSGWPQLFPQLNPGPTTVSAVTQTYTTSGSWQAPTGVTSVTVEAWGGGGAGGKGGSSNKNGGGGGAGGGYARKVVTVTPGNSYSYVVGSGGTATAANGNPGGDTTFNTNSVVARGGGGGASYANGATGGISPTTGLVGDTTYWGGEGAAGTSTYSGGGGGGAGSTNYGQSATTYTGGTATSENGGAGGNGSTSNSGNGGAGSTYGGGGAGSTKNGIPGDGAVGLIRLTYNSSPSFTVNTSDSPDPVTSGNNVTFTATATDAESNNWYLAVCKTNSVTAGSPPTCAASQTLCVSSSAVSSGSQNSCTWTSSGTGDQSWYAFACDNASTNPICSSANTTNSPVTVNAAIVYSVSISPGGTIAYGNVEVGQSQNTVDLLATQTATNNGTGTEKLNIKTSDAVNGTGWTLGSSAGTNIFVHEFSTNSGGNWTQFTTTDTYQTLSSSVAVSGTVDFDLRITAPTSSDAVQKSITVTVQAVAP